MLRPNRREKACRPQQQRSPGRNGMPIRRRISDLWTPARRTSCILSFLSAPMTAATGPIKERPVGKAKHPDPRCFSANDRSRGGGGHPEPQFRGQDHEKVGKGLVRGLVPAKDRVLPGAPRSKPQFCHFWRHRQSVRTPAWASAQQGQGCGQIGRQDCPRSLSCQQGGAQGHLLRPFKQRHQGLPRALQSVKFVTATNMRSPIKILRHRVLADRHASSFLGGGRGFPVRCRSGKAGPLLGPVTVSLHGKRPHRGRRINFNRLAWRIPYGLRVCFLRSTRGIIPRVPTRANATTTHGSCTMRKATFRSRGQTWPRRSITSSTNKMGRPLYSSALPCVGGKRILHIG